jgi:hypothetical protein
VKKLKKEENGEEDLDEEDEPEGEEDEEEEFAEGEDDLDEADGKLLHITHFFNIIAISCIHFSGCSEDEDDDVDGVEEEDDV